MDELQTFPPLTRGTTYDIDIPLVGEDDSPLTETEVAELAATWSAVCELRTRPSGPLAALLSTDSGTLAWVPERAALSLHIGHAVSMTLRGDLLGAVFLRREQPGEDHVELLVAFRLPVTRHSGAGGI